VWYGHAYLGKAIVSHCSDGKRTGTAHVRGQNITTWSPKPHWNFTIANRKQIVMFLVHYTTHFAQKPHWNSSSLETLNLQSPNVVHVPQLLRNWISSTLQASASVRITPKPDETEVPATATNYLNSKHRLTGTQPEGLKSRQQHYRYYNRGWSVEQTKSH
jgi:hypothetical protein